MQTPLVSIIIPTYNRAHLIGETLDSVLAQTYSNWECIVVDDESTDNTAQLMQTYCERDQRFQYHYRPSNKPKGANACRNYGLKLSKGKYLIFLDSDDVIISTCLKNRVFKIEDSTFDMIVFSMGRFEDIKQLKIDHNRIVINKTIDETIVEFLKGKLPWNICRPIFRAQKLKENNIFFNEKLFRLQDIEFNIHVLHKLRPSYISIDETDCYYRYDNVIAQKYFTKEFGKLLFLSLFHYYISIFLLFTYDFKLRNRQLFIRQLYIFIKSYYRKHVNEENIIKIIKLFENELNLTFKEKISLFLSIYLNKYLYNKRGYHRLSSKIKFLGK